MFHSAGDVGDVQPMVDPTSDPQAIRPKVLVWRAGWLAGSETFIRAQTESLSRWEGVAVGVQKVESGLARDADIVVYGASEVDRVRRSLFRWTGASRPLRRVVECIQPDIIHAHFATDAVLIAPLARRMKIPMVVTLHGFDVTEAPSRPGLKGRVFRFRLRRLLRQTSLLLAVSEHIAQATRLLGAEASRIRTQPIGVRVPHALEQVAEEPDWDVLFVGRLVQKKGVDDLLRAVASLNKGNLRVAIVGDGVLARELESLAAELGVTVNFLGNRSRETVVRLMHAAGVLAVPSRTSVGGDSEGLPTVILEAFAVGLPVVATRHAGIPEAVVDGVTGLLVDEQSPLQLAAAIDRVLSDRSLRTRVVMSAFDSVKQNFNLRTRTAELEAIYDEVATAR